MKMKHIVGLSGGIDSQATALWVRNRFPAPTPRAVSSIREFSDGDLIELMGQVGIAGIPRPLQERARLALAHLKMTEGW
jgi:hypothetical protein